MRGLGLGLGECVSSGRERPCIELRSERVFMRWLTHDPAHRNCKSGLSSSSKLTLQSYRSLAESLAPCISRSSGVVLAQAAATETTT
eukprot:5219987-Amphidinium_carterae.1